MLEVLVVAVTLFLAVMFLFPQHLDRRHRNLTHYSRIKCVNNLKNVGLAFRIYATDNNDLFPWHVLAKSGLELELASDPAKYLRQLSNELSTPKIVFCPQDYRAAATNWNDAFTRHNISYFVSPSSSEMLPQSFLAGDRNITSNGSRVARGLNRLPFMARLDWDATLHTNQGNICVGDGSVQQLSGARLRDQFKNTGLTNEMILSVP